MSAVREPGDSAILAADRRRNRLLAALTVVAAGVLATLLYVLFAS